MVPVFGENAKGVLFPVSNYSAPVDDAPWVPPPPHGRPVLDDISGERGNSGVYYGSRVLMAAGGLLCAGGIVVMAGGFSDNLNTESMHSGGLMIISGALVAAIFSVVSQSSRERPEAETEKISGTVAR